MPGRPASKSDQNVASVSLFSSGIGGNSMMRDRSIRSPRVPKTAGLGFQFVANERYDFAVPEERWDRPAVVALRRLLEDPTVRAELADRGFS